MRKGFTLVECLLASSIFCLMTLVLFEGVIVSTRIAHENSELLAAEAVAWDAVWKRFNESVDDLPKDEDAWQSLAEEAAPELFRYDQPPRLRMTVKVQDDQLDWNRYLRRISADVEWGPSDNRHRLSDCRQMPVVYRGELGRSF